MPFKLVYYSQQDSQWKADRLGFGTQQSDTIGYIGCALTSVAMMLSGHGFTESPKTLNKKLQSIDGFAGAGIRWYHVSQLYPQIRINSIIKCNDTAAPLAQIDAAIASGQPAIVQVDSTPAPGILTHYVVLYARNGNDYLMLDPWPYQPDVKKETYLMPRYSQGNPLQRSILQIVLFENVAADGVILMPGASTPTTSPSTGTPSPSGPPVTVPVSTDAGAQARVKDDVTWGLNIRTSEDTSSKANIVTVVPAGAMLSIIEPGGVSKIGGINQWVRVCTPNGKEGLAAAWYLEKVPGAATVPETESSTSVVLNGVEAPLSEAPTSGEDVPSTESTPAAESTPQKSKLVVRVKKNGLQVYEFSSGKGKVLSTEKTGAKLVVVEDAAKAVAKVGTAGKWLNVKATNNKRGFVDAGSVKVV
ncbi:MAG: SH3 domain-containing protein [Anaerolineae bacterium]|nr:SH3 domain-containing protein [Anaerolineae bacterium]